MRSQVGKTLLSLFLVSAVHFSASACALAAEKFFSIAEVMHGKKANRASCDSMASAVWVTADNTSECLVYFISKHWPGKDAVVLLNGDVVYEVGPKSKQKFVDPRYAKSSAEGEMKYAEKSGVRFERTFLELARPGTMGSSGSESTVRHTVHEARLISAALDAIAVKEGIERFHLVGHSGGAMIVGALLASRQDIGCAVLGSGRLTLPAAAKILDTRKPFSEEVADSYLNDANYADEIPNDPSLRVFVLTDPLDKLSEFDGQNEFVRRAKDSGVPIVQLLTSSIVDNGEHHDVQRQANDVLQLCIDGKPDAFIATKIQEASEINKAAWAAAK